MPIKGVLLLAFLGLTVASFGLYFSREHTVSGAPIVYMTGSPGPDGQEMVRRFREWLAKENLSDVDLRIDASNSDPSKVVIQGISGIGADLIPSNLGPDLRYLKAMGLLTDLTDVAEHGGFGPKTFASVAQVETGIDGRQFAYPTLLYVLMNYANLDTFALLDLPPPPPQMSFDEFEALGKQFVEKANPPGQKRRRFFCNAVSPLTMRRSLGLDTFNETLTQCTLDDPRNIRVLSLIHQWTYDVRLLPSATDMASFASDGSTASSFGPRLYQFAQGNIAIIAGGSYLTNSLRKLGNLRLAVLEPPNGGFPNAVFGAAMLALYAGSPNPEAAMRYLRFLASPEYSTQLIASGQGIPANLTMARHPDFLHPPDHPNEWGCNERFVDAIETIGIPYTPSPFVLYSVYHRISEEAFERFMADRCTAEEAARRAADGINAEIARTLEEQPELKERHEVLTARQREIDARRSRGEKVPLAWIENPFHRLYYQAQGWIE